MVVINCFVLYRVNVVTFHTLISGFCCIVAALLVLQNLHHTTLINAIRKREEKWQFRRRNLHGHEMHLNRQQLQFGAYFGVCRGLCVEAQHCIAFLLVVHVRTEPVKLVLGWRREPNNSKLHTWYTKWVSSSFSYEVLWRLMTCLPC